MVVDCWAKHKKQVENICKKHGITINISEKWHANPNTKTINVPAIDCMMHYCVNLHEIGHLVKEKANPSNYPNEIMTGLFFGAGAMPSILYMELEANKFVVENAIGCASEILEILHDQFIDYWKRAQKRRTTKKPRSRFCKALVNKDLGLLKASFRCLA